MKIQYYSSGDTKVIITREIADNDIISWRISSELGWKNGALIIDHLDDKTREVTGIYPPVDSIISFDTTIQYLKTNLSKKNGVT